MKSGKNENLNKIVGEENESDLNVETVVRQWIKSVVRECLADMALTSEKPEIISLKEACRVCGGIDKQTILTLVHSAESTGFPAIILGPRTIKVDRTRLRRWLHAGGLKIKVSKE